MKRMQTIQPQLQQLQKQYKNDKEKLMQEQMRIYKEHGVNPVAGCLPMVIQIPVFFALYKVIFTTIEMRHAPFFGWMKDLSAPDPTNVFTLFGLVLSMTIAVPLGILAAVKQGSWIDHTCRVVALPASRDLERCLQIERRAARQLEFFDDVVALAVLKPASGLAFHRQ